MKEKLQSTFGENLKIRLDPKIRLDFELYSAFTIEP